MTGTGDGDVVVWERGDAAAAGASGGGARAAAKLIRLGEGSLTVVATCGDSRFLVLAGEDGAVRFYDMQVPLKRAVGRVQECSRPATRVEVLAGGPAIVRPPPLPTLLLSPLATPRVFRALRVCACAFLRAYLRVSFKINIQPPRARSCVLWQFRLEAWFEDLDAGAVTSVSFALAAPSDHAARLDFSTPDFVVWPQNTARVCVCLFVSKRALSSRLCADRQRAHF